MARRDATWSIDVEASSPSTVLLTEDDDIVARPIARLRDPSVKLLRACTTNEALDYIEAERSIRVALIDVQLGNDVRGGLRVLDALAESHPTALSALLTASRESIVMLRAFERRALFVDGLSASEAPTRPLIERPTDPVIEVVSIDLDVAVAELELEPDATIEE